VSSAATLLPEKRSIHTQIDDKKARVNIELEVVALQAGFPEKEDAQAAGEQVERRAD